MPAGLRRVEVERACYIVKGKVQGVWFRASTRDRAVALGLAGHARNLPNGDVEVLVVGPAAAVDQLADWLRVGPPLARVDSVQCQARSGMAEGSSMTGFTTA